MSSAPALVLDFETYYEAKGYTLKKMPVPEYVFHPKFKIHGLAIRHPHGKREFRPDAGLAIRELKTLYGEKFEKVIVICHNAMFDLFILEKIFNTEVRRFIDTMLLSYVVWGRRGKEGGESAALEKLAQRYGLQDKGHIEFMRDVYDPTPQQLADLAAYAMNDADLEFKIANKMLPIVSRLKVEWLLWEHTVRLFLKKKIYVDVAGLKALRTEIQETNIKFLNTFRDFIRDVNPTEALIARVGSIQRQEAPPKVLAVEDITFENLSKNKKFTEILEAALARIGCKVPMKKGKNGFIPATAKTDEAMQALVNHDDPIVSSLAQARLGKKSEDQLLAKLGTLERIALATGGYLPPCLTYYGAWTGRWAGGGKFNIQNLGRKDYGLRMRGLLIPALGYKFVIADLMQIEARVLAWVAGQEDLTGAFRENRDIYSEKATVAFKREVRKHNSSDSPEVAEMFKAYRHVGKTLILGLGYGMGSLKFSNTLKAEPLTAPFFDTKVLTLTLCKQLVEDYRHTYLYIPKYWYAVEDAFRNAIRGQPTEYRGTVFRKVGDVVLICLPSGRQLRYPGARLEMMSRKFRYLDGEDTVESSSIRNVIVYGNNVSIYGGKITENIVQALARDILGESILRLEEKGWPILFHAHDENVLEVPEADAPRALKEVEHEMTINPSWARGLPIGVEASIAARYSK